MASIIIEPITSEEYDKIRENMSFLTIKRMAEAHMKMGLSFFYSEVTGPRKRVVFTINAEFEDVAQKKGCIIVEGADYRDDIFFPPKIACNRLKCYKDGMFWSIKNPPTCKVFKTKEELSTLLENMLSYATPPSSNPRSDPQLYYLHRKLQEKEDGLRRHAQAENELFVQNSSTSLKSGFDDIVMVLNDGEVAASEDAHVEPILPGVDMIVSSVKSYRSRREREDRKELHPYARQAIRQTTCDLFYDHFTATFAGRDLMALREPICNMLYIL